MNYRIRKGDPRHVPEARERTGPKPAQRVVRIPWRDNKTLIRILRATR